MGVSGELGPEEECRGWDVQAMSELGFVGARSGGLSGDFGWVGAVGSMEQELSWALESPATLAGGER